MASMIYNELNNSGEAKEISPYIAGLKQQLRRELNRINRNFFGSKDIITTRPFVPDGNNSLQGVFP
jgi:hypothetical protein